jgi:hypothetical protein
MREEMRKDEKGEDGPKGSVERMSATAVREREETEKATGM